MEAMMKMLNEKQSASAKQAEYATAEDFCKIFHTDMRSLYLLSLLLTGDHTRAEQCFVGGLETAVKRNTVFQEWARNWARRVIVQNALRTINPRPSNGTEVSMANAGQMRSEQAEIAAVLALPSFDRFVFVMSVLEGYSDQDCSILLGCTRGEVSAARFRALQEIGTAAELLHPQRMSATQDTPVLIKSNDSLRHREIYYAKLVNA